MSTVTEHARHYTAALRWAKYARENGARFDVEKKAASALAFSLSVGAHRFAVPSKLVGTKEHAPRLVALASLLRDDGPQLLRLDLDGVARCPALRCGEGAGCAVGHVQKKHLGWLLPLVRQRAVRCFALNITGGTEQKPTRGLNVVFSFTAARS
jgi:hypothetical protein